MGTKALRKKLPLKRGEGKKGGKKKLGRAHVLPQKGRPGRLEQAVPVRPWWENEGGEKGRARGRNRGAVSSRKTKAERGKKKGPEREKPWTLACRGNVWVGEKK